MPHRNSLKGKVRLDQTLVDRSLAKDIHTSQALILAGKIIVNHQVISKAGYQTKNDDLIKIKKIRKWVSRSAEKLEAAIYTWKFPVYNQTFIDIGASTGGFTEFLLANSAKKIISLDIAYGFLHPKLRKNSNVYVVERQHICNTSLQDLPFNPSYFVMDVSFISQRRVLRHLKSIKLNWEGIFLFKPQFEAEPKELSKGVVKDPKCLEKLLDRIKNFLKEEKIEIKNVLPSPVLGKKGNQEFLFWLRW